MPQPARLKFRMPAKLVARPLRPLPNFIRQKLNPEQPKLYNGKRLIPTSRGVPKAVLSQNIQNGQWRQHVSEDVEQFIDDMEAQGTKLSPREERSLLKSPSVYFAQQANVPKSLRKQIYFPTEFISIRRTTHLGPNYARFNVPLSFSKLELISYLKEVYNVDVISVRSIVTPSQVKRRRPINQRTRPELYRTRSQKRMIVRLLEPFDWPAKVTSSERAASDYKGFHNVSRAGGADQLASTFAGPEKYTMVDRVHRKSIADQAKLMHLGKAEWTPTWQLFDTTRQQFAGKEQIPSGRVDQKLLPSGAVP